MSQRRAFVVGDRVVLHASGTVISTLSVPFIEIVLDGLSEHPNAWNHVRVSPEYIQKIEPQQDNGWRDVCADMIRDQRDDEAIRLLAEKLNIVAVRPEYHANHMRLQNVAHLASAFLGAINPHAPLTSERNGEAEVMLDRLAAAIRVAKPLPDDEVDW